MPRTIPTAAAPALLWNRPRLRFLEGAADGAAPATGAAPAAPADPAPDGEQLPEGADKLGDAGKQALDRMKQERNEARETLRAFQELGLTAEQVKELVGRDQQASEQALKEQAKREAAEEAQARLATKLRATEVRAQATALGFHNPADALAHLTADQLAAIDVSATDDVDAEAVKALLADVVKDRPYLVASTTPPIATHRAAGIGAGTATGPAPTTPGMGTLRAAYEATSKH